MDWDRYELYFGPTRVGTVIYDPDDSYPSEPHGNIIDDPNLADADSPEALRIAGFLALCRASADLEGEELDAALRELKGYRADVLESDRWHLVDGQGHRSPIQCPDFRGDDEIVWSWVGPQIGE